MGRPFFLTVRPRACTARQTVGTLAGVARASFSSASVRSGCAAMSAARVWEMRFEHGASTVTLDARRHLTCLAPPLLQQPHPRPAHAVLCRDIGGLHLGIAIEQRPLS